MNFRNLIIYRTAYCPFLMSLMLWENNSMLEKLTIGNYTHFDKTLWRSFKKDLKKLQQ
jgi:hypothetical protein